MRDSFVIFTEHGAIVDDLTDDQAGKVFKALIATQLDMEPEIEDQAARIVYKTILSQVNRSHAMYDKKVASGKQGSSKRWESNSTDIAPYSTPIANDSTAIANDSTPIASDSKAYNPVPVPDIKETLTKVSVKKFTPPTLQEIQDYVKERKSPVDAEKFFDFYESNGWMVGKNRMKDWKAAFRNWERSQRQETTAKGRQETTANRFNSFKQREYDYEELEKRLTGRVI